MVAEDSLAHVGRVCVALLALDTCRDVETKIAPLKYARVL